MKQLLAGVLLGGALTSGVFLAVQFVSRPAEPDRSSAEIGLSLDQLQVIHDQLDSISESLDLQLRRTDPALVLPPDREGGPEGPISADAPAVERTTAAPPSDEASQSDDGQSYKAAKRLDLLPSPIRDILVSGNAPVMDPRVWATAQDYAKRYATAKVDLAHAVQEAVEKEREWMKSQNLASFRPQDSPFRYEITTTLQPRLDAVPDDFRAALEALGWSAH